MNRHKRRARAKGKSFDYFAQLRKANPERTITQADIDAIEALAITKVLKRDTDFGAKNG